MENALAEMPLALFSTLAPIGAGAFVILAIVSFASKLDDAKTRSMEKFSIVPMGFVLVGFIAAFFHLASPLHALGVFAGLGSSSLSNELAVGVAFFVLAAAYTGFAFCGKLGKARLPLLAAVGVAGIAFCVFVGLAYQMPTIPSWNTPIVPFEMVFLGLAGGAALVALGLSHHAAATDDGTQEKAFIVTVACGFVGAIGSSILTFVYLAVVGGISNAAVSGSMLVNEAMPWAVASAILLVAAAFACAIGRKRSRIASTWIAVFSSAIGILLARMVFYGLEISTGLSF